MNNKIKKAYDIYRAYGLRGLIKRTASASKKRPSLPVGTSLVWQKKFYEFREEVLKTRHCHKYFDLVKCLAGHSLFSYKVIPLFSIPLLLRPTNIVELGSAFTSYLEKCNDPWGRYDKLEEGLISTRVLLTACRFLNKYGIKASLTSIDIRDDKKKFEDTERHLQELDLLQYWKPFYGTDSLDWLKRNKDLIHLAYVDSSHTYKQVKAELEALAPQMIQNGVIIIDDGFTINDPSDVSWRVNEDEGGRSKGGEFGAVLDFLKEHPEWRNTWSPEGMVYLCRNASVMKFLSE